MKPLPPSEQTAVLRIIDAAANRAGEGLRGVEDYVRFVLDDPHLTELAKQLRHELAAVMAQVPTADRLAARETTADVGTRIQTAAESSRSDAAQIAAAAFKRLQQSLRSLEEHFKLWDSPAAAQLEALRYRTYTLERAVATTGDSLTRVAAARLYVLIDEPWTHSNNSANWPRRWSPRGPTRCNFATNGSTIDSFWPARGSCAKSRRAHRRCSS